MAKKKNEEAAGAAAEVKKENPAPAVEDKKRAVVSITTTEGRTLDSVSVYYESDGPKVSASYGKLNPEGKTFQEKRAGMSRLMSRSLTPEQAQKFMNEGGVNSQKALENVARAAFPMHVDDAAYHKKDTQINGRPVNYINIEKLDEKNLKEEYKHLAGEMRLSFGVKGDTSTRFLGLLNKEEKAMLRNRSEVVLDKDGKVKALGAPLTLAEIAGRVEQRVLAQRQARDQKTNDAKAVHWDKFKLPEGANVEKLRWFPTQDPNCIRLTGVVNNMPVSGLLSKNESTAVREKMATMKQAMAANNELSKKVKGIVAIAKAGQAADNVVKMIVDRASDKSAKSFTPEQTKAIKEFAAGSESVEDRKALFGSLMDKAAPQLEGVNPKWVDNVREELNDLAEGREREQSQGISR